VSAPNEFNKDLAFSEQASQREFWMDAYRQFFVDLVDYTCNFPEGSRAQLNGIDRVLTLKSGREVRIDEKTRRPRYSPGEHGILLEVVSNNTTPGNDGWMNKSLMIDYLAYGFAGPEVAYLFPWDALRKAWVNNRNNWKEKAWAEVDGFKAIPARNPNEGYTTWSVAVPTDTLLAAVSSAQVVEVSNKGETGGNEESREDLYGEDEQVGLV